MDRCTLKQFPEKDPPLTAHFQSNLLKQGNKPVILTTVDRERGGLSSAHSGAHFTISVQDRRRKDALAGTHLVPFA